MRAAVAAAGAALLLAGCGTASPDLFVVDRTGSVPGGNLKLQVVDDGTVRCNGGDPREIGSARLLEARKLTDDLQEVEQAEVRAGAPQVFGFLVRSEAGVLRFPDTAASPPVLPELARFTRTLAQDVCGLAR